MNRFLCFIAILVGVGILVGYLVSHRPNIKNNEANGPTNVRRFKGYKASLQTPVNGGTPLYGESVTGHTTSTFRSA